MVSKRRSAAAAACLLLAACGAAAPSPAPTAGPTPNVASALLATPAPATSAPRNSGAPRRSSQPAAYQPAPRAAAAVAWDPARELVLLFGGSGGPGVTNDLDGWDGTSW